MVLGGRVSCVLATPDPTVPLQKQVGLRRAFEAVGYAVLSAFSFFLSFFFCFLFFVFASLSFY